MGIDVTALLGGLTGIGNLVGQGANLAGTGMSMGNALFDYLRYFQRNSDPTLNAVRQYQVNRFNQSPYGPYGDVTGGYGGMWGTDTAGNPVQFGDMAANQLNYMLQNNPSMAAMAQLNNAASMQRPGMPSMSDMMSGSVTQANMPAYQQQVQPIPESAPVQTNNVYNGIAGPTGPNPQIPSPQGGAGTAVRTATSGIRGQIQDRANQFAGLNAGNEQSGGGPGKPAPGGSGGGGGLPQFTGGGQGRNILTGAALGFLGAGGARGGQNREPRWQMVGSQPIRQYEQGTDFIPPDTTVANIHEGERVISADQNMGRLMEMLGMQMGQRAAGKMQDVRQNMIDRKQQPTPADTAAYTGGIPQYAGDRMGLQYMPSYAQGIDYVPQTGPAIVPVGGAVIPKKENMPSYQTGTPFIPPAPKRNPMQDASTVPAGAQNLYGSGQARANATSAAPTPPPPPPQNVPPPPGPPQTTGNVPKPNVPQPNIDQGRVSTVAGLLNNPESLSPQVQQMMFQRMADQTDTTMQDANRQLQERMGSQGLGDSGIQEYLRMQNQLGRQSNLNNAQRDIGILAATQNFQDRQNVANLALNHQLGVGNQALQYSALQNQMFNQDRDYQTGLANSIFGLGQAGQNQQANILAQLGGLTQSGLGYNDALANLIYGQTQGRYADPNISAVQQFNYAQNPYLQLMAGQNQGGGSDWTSWLNAGAAAGSAGADLYGLFKS